MDSSRKRARGVNGDVLCINHYNTLCSQEFCNLMLYKTD